MQHKQLKLDQEKQLKVEQSRMMMLEQGKKSQLEKLRTEHTEKQKILQCQKQWKMQLNHELKTQNNQQYQLHEQQSHQWTEQQKSHNPRSFKKKERKALQEMLMQFARQAREYDPLSDIYQQNVQQQIQTELLRQQQQEKELQQRLLWEEQQHQQEQLQQKLLLAIHQKEHEQERVKQRLLMEQQQRQQEKERLQLQLKLEKKQRDQEQERLQLHLMLEKQRVEQEQERVRQITQRQQQQQRQQTHKPVIAPITPNRVVFPPSTVSDKDATANPYHRNMLSVINHSYNSTANNELYFNSSSDVDIMPRNISAHNANERELLQRNIWIRRFGENSISASMQVTDTASRLDSKSSAMSYFPPVSVRNRLFGSNSGMVNAGQNLHHMTMVASYRGTVDGTNGASNVSMANTAISSTSQDASRMEDEFGMWAQEYTIPKTLSQSRPTLGPKASHEPDPPLSMSSAPSLLTNLLSNVKQDEPNALSAMSLPVVSAPARPAAMRTQHQEHDDGSESLPTRVLPALVNPHSAGTTNSSDQVPAMNRVNSLHLPPQQRNTLTPNALEVNTNDMISEQISKGTERLLAKVTTMNKSTMNIYRHLNTT